eukprot:1604578-Ditylum_brightwellii.AAC.1
MERSKQNKHVIGKKDNGVDDSVGNSVDNGVDDIVDDSDDDSDDGVGKHLAHLSQAVVWCLTETSKQNKHIVGKKDNGVDDSFGNGYYNGVDDSDDSAIKRLTHLLVAMLLTRNHVRTDDIMLSE